MTYEERKGDIHLPDRLAIIASYIENNETVADIGTDHGLLPIFLWQKGICNNVILSDLRDGPLNKARLNIDALAPDFKADIRKGYGLDTLSPAEVNTVVISGMGGLLIKDILSANIEKTRTYSKLILQPRNASDKLRKWLVQNNFIIKDEQLVKEGNHLCEIIVAHTVANNKTIQYNDELDYEISPILFLVKDPLLKEFIKRKIVIEEKIIKEIETYGTKKSFHKSLEAKKRLILLKDLLKKVNMMDEEKGRNKNVNRV